VNERTEGGGTHEVDIRVERGEDVRRTDSSRSSVVVDHLKGRVEGGEKSGSGDG